MSRLARDPRVEALVAAYRVDLEADGQYARKEVSSPSVVMIGGWWRG